MLRDSIAIQIRFHTWTSYFDFQQKKKKKKKQLFLCSIFSEVISQTVTLTIKTNLNYPSNQKMQKVLSKKFRNGIF